jgi:hypothetical protein
MLFRTLPFLCILLPSIFGHAASAACVEAFKAMTFIERVAAVIGEDRIQGRIEVGTNAIPLNAEDVASLFSDVQDPWVARMGRYIVNGIKKGDTTVVLTSDAKGINFSAGTSWNGFYSGHDLTVLLDPDYSGGNPLKNGIRNAARLVLIHEAMHSRISDYQVKWMKEHNVDVAWHKRMHTATEEFLARMAEQKTLGNTGWNAKIRAWFSTLIDGGEFVRPWTELETEWTRVLREQGIEVR